MSYTYSGPISSLLNGVAALLSVASSYFAPATRPSVLVGPSFVRRLISTGRFSTFLETYGAISLHTQHFGSLSTGAQEMLNGLVDKGLVNPLKSEEEAPELLELLKSQLSDEEAWVLARALRDRARTVFLGSNEAKRMAVELGIRALSYEEFVVEAYRRGLLSSAEVLGDL